MNAASVPIIPAIELKRILYATDFSEASGAALPVVAAVARRYGSRVYAAHVWSQPAYPMADSHVVTILDRKQEREAKDELDKLLRTPIFAGVETEAVLCYGDVARQLERVVRQKHINLVIAGTHGRTGFKRRVLGSFTEELVRSLSCPVLTVGPQVAKRPASGAIEHILFATDFSEESLSVVPYLASLAQEYRSRITVLHVLPEEKGDSADSDLAEFLRREMEQALAPQISPRCRSEFMVKRGDPAEEILAEARLHNVDLICLGVRGSTDIARHFRETVAYRILAEAECPVLTYHARSDW